MTSHDGTGLPVCLSLYYEQAAVLRTLRAHYGNGRRSLVAQPLYDAKTRCGHRANDAPRTRAEAMNRCNAVGQPRRGRIAHCDTAKTETSTLQLFKDITMNSLIKTVVVATLAVTALAASAGEISDSNIDAYMAKNQTFSAGAYAAQEIGSVNGNGRMVSSTVWARGTSNEAASRGSWSIQSIGIVNGKMENSVIWADGARNRSAGEGARALQEIGLIGTGGS